MKILVSGFRPFLGESLNPSQVLLEKHLKPLSSQDLATVLLPVEFSNSIKVLLQEVEKTQADFVLMLGQAAGRAKVSFEQVALNLLDSQFADEAGERRQNQKVIPNGPEAYISPLPLREWAEQISALGLPAERSLSAGSFVCNFLYYQMNAFAQDEPFQKLQNRLLFVHLPLLPEQVVKMPAGEARPYLELQVITKVIDELLMKIRQRK